MVEFDVLWYKVLKSRYDDIYLKAVNFNDFQSNLGRTSLWWRDLSKLDSFYLERLLKNCLFRGSNGFSTLFLHSKWVGISSSLMFFPLIYSPSLLKNVVVASLGGWAGEGWRREELGCSNTALQNNSAAVEVQVLGWILQQIQLRFVGCDTVS